MLKQQIIKKMNEFFQNAGWNIGYFCYHKLYHVPDVNIFLNYLHDALSVYMTNAKNK